VSDFDGVVDDLRSRGVTFEEYNSPPVVTENGVATIGGVKSAWFKDPDGNLLGIVTPVG
jgi:hypothetical protein